MTSHNSRLAKLENRQPAQALTWRDLVEIARMEPAELEAMQRDNPEKHAGYLAVIAEATASGNDAAEMLQALR